MNKYKDTYELFQSIFDEVHASDELLRKVKNMTEIKTKKKINFKVISAIAACLVAVILGTVIFGNLSGDGNFFVLKANAAEIGRDSLVKIGDIAPVGGSSGSVISGDNKVETISSILPFAVNCEGRNIKSIKYKIKNGVFLFPYNSYAKNYRNMYSDIAEISDKIYDKVEAKNKIKNEIENDKQYTSYTVNYEEQLALENHTDLQTLPIQINSIISSDDEISEESRYALQNVLSGTSNPSEEENTENKLEDKEYIAELMKAFQTVYDEMYSRITISVEVTYNDGTKESEILRLGCENVSEENGITIGAKVISNGNVEEY